jgi:N-acetylmuramate 1-kinase
MESAQELKISEIKKAERQSALEHWLDSICHVQPASLQRMAGDASLRQYFRVQVGSQSFVVMDAPPPQENCHAYATISAALRKLGLQSPEIIQAAFY